MVEVVSIFAIVIGAATLIAMVAYVIAMTRKKK